MTLKNEPTQVIVLTAPMALPNIIIKLIAARLFNI